MKKSIDLSFETLRKTYANGAHPRDVILAAVARIKSADLNAWIYVEDEETLIAQCDLLEKRRLLGDELPLFGIPFGVKDNIDVGGMPTTAACREFTYHPEQSAHAVQLLLDNGAICIGKTNLDQFATGLSGARSPFGICASVQNPAYISGGSSSGSGVSVAAGHVSFALGTDTGGSGRIPAGFNGIVGVKPTLGKVSLRGVVPNCLSLDCVSVFAGNVADGMAVLRVMGDYDDADPYSTPPLHRQSAGHEPSQKTFSFGRLAKQDLEFFGMDECGDLYEHACRRLIAIGGQPTEIDFAPFMEAGRLMFDGPWIAERKSAIGPFAEQNSGVLLDVTQKVLDVANKFSAVDAFNGLHRLAQLKRTAEKVFASISMLAVPTSPRPFTIEEMVKNPIELNTRVGYYTHFAHLLDLCAIAVPNGVLTCGVPMGVTLLAPAWRDEPLGATALRLEHETKIMQLEAAHA